jgi:DNA polymerase-3 subunit gamma/tau
VSYLALYRKYRPTNLEDLVGQSDVSSIIKNEILSNKISHAYLFSGPRGTGKTSTAKIIAKMVNCLNLGEDGIPCGKCSSCNDVNSSDIVEIDAASNNGVDEIRELRDKVNLVPTYGKYKIYIIDEVHMLTIQAFNALLKTLEEPPSHVIFILATTEFYKIPDTVVSRCQKFQFLKFSVNDIFERLREISKLEDISISDDSLYEIARLSDGGLRDAINMLDQLSSFKNGCIEIDDVYKLNSVVSYNELVELLLFVYNNNICEIISLLEQIDKEGKNFDKFISDIIEFFKDVLIYKNVSELNVNIVDKKEKIIEISNLYSSDVVYKIIFELNELSNKLKDSNFSLILLVSYFINLSNKLTDKKDKKNNNDVSQNNVNVKEGTDKVKLIVDNKYNNISDKLKKIRINNTFATAYKKYKDELLNKWSDVIKKAKDDKYGLIDGIINDIDVLVVGEKNIIFLVKYNSLIDRIYNYEEDLKKLLFDVFQKSFDIVFLTSDEWLYEKKKYIDNLKIGEKYQYIIEDNNDDINLDDVTQKNGDSSIEKIISILGNDVIFYK